MDIYQYLKRDHEEIKNLMTELISLNENDGYRHTVIDRIASEFIPHSRAEEAVFYNALRASDADTGILLHSFKEHVEAEALLRLLQARDKVDLDWKKTAIKLQEALERHIQDEETKIFSLAQIILSNEEAIQIGDAFINLKKEYKGHGVIKNSIDMVMNLIPPRLAKKVHDLNINPKT